jgi:hypothetical protein
MNENNSITITFKVQIDEVNQTIESGFPYHGDAETLEKIVCETINCLYSLGWSREKTNEAINKFTF